MIGYVPTIHIWPAQDGNTVFTQNPRPSKLLLIVIGQTGEEGEFQEIY